MVYSKWHEVKPAKVQEFSKGWGGGGVTLRQTDGTHQIFLSVVVGCLLKRKLTKEVGGGGGVGGCTRR